VGRNPRSIKRVVNYTNLLERIHSNNCGRETTDGECKILFALVCMQIAWPELFQYFTRDPSVDLITSLQNWEFLDDLPEAASLFDRSPDRENNVDASPLVESFLENVFLKSVWYLGTEIKYRRVGHRYVTLVHDRRQGGTIVSLKSQPFVFRLAMSPEKVMGPSRITGRASSQSIKKPSCWYATPLAAKPH
jgi:hypothetical protein